MAVSQNDTFLASFPKSGTTWLLNIVYHLSGKGAQTVDQLIPWLDCDPYSIEPCGSPRFFKTHVPFGWLPYDPSARYIYVARNPKDVAVSFYYFLENMQHQVAGYKKENEVDMASFIDFFEEERVLYGSWWDHVNSWYEASLKYPNVLFITYEELSRDLSASISTIARFLEKEVDEETLGRITEKCTFSSMKNDKQSSMAYCKNFWRKGVCGDHVNFFTEAQVQRFDERNKQKLPQKLMDRLE